MELSYYIAKWGWGSIFVMMWISALGYRAPNFTLWVIAAVVFILVTILSTAYYAYAKYTKWQLVRKYAK